MKILNKIMLFMVAISFLASCSKTTDDEVKLSDPIAPVLVTPDGSLNYVLTKDNENNPFETFIYDGANYGLPIVVNYIIELDKEGGDFSEPIVMQESTTQLFQTISVKNFNVVAVNALGATPEQETIIKVRVKAASSNDDIAILHSNVMELKVTTYDATIPPLWLVGDATSIGWNPADAFEITAISPTQFEITTELLVGKDAGGYDFSFGILGQKDWGPNRWFWDDFDIKEGVQLAVNQYDEKQFMVAEAGTYKIEINLGNKSLKVTKQ